MHRPLRLTVDRAALVQNWRWLANRAGVPAGAVQDARDRAEADEQLRARGYFTRLRNTDTGEWPAEELPFRMSATPPRAGGRIGRGAPSIGEDNAAVYGELLGLGADEIRRGEEEGLFR